MKVKIHVTPTGRNLTLKIGANLRRGLVESGIPLDSPCGGQGTCLKCKVRLSGVSQRVTELEQEKLSPQELESGWRLVCQVRVEEAGEVYVPLAEISRVKAALTALGMEIPLRPDVRRVHFQLGEPSLADQRADWDRLAEYLEIAGASPTVPELSFFQELPAKLREQGFAGEAILVGNMVADVDPPHSSRELLGVALDLGTTSLAAGLVDLDTGRLIAIDATQNRQISFGADVISRILYAQENPEGSQRLQSEMLKGLNRLLIQVCSAAGKSRGRIFEATVVGNTTMLHSFVGLDATYIALSPFVGVVNRSLSLSARELGLQIHPRGMVHILPAIASFVGADAVTVILATGLHRTNVLKLAIDIGTNTEIILATPHQIFTASAAAGPAFEGGRIKFGMRATTGAISKFQVIPSLSYTVIGDGAPRGICGSALVDLVAELSKAGVINRTGRMLSASEASSLPMGYLAKHIQEDGGKEFVIYKDADRKVALTQQDVRELQLAKAAIRAGIEVLLKEAKVNLQDVQEVFLAGTFGNYVSREKVLTLGLLPPFSIDRIHFAGNAAIDGALSALINVQERHQAERIAAEVKHIELSGRADFQEAFIHSLELGS